MLDFPDRQQEASATWDSDLQQFLDAARQKVNFDGLALALFHGKNPQPDELLANNAIPLEQVNRWCSDGLEASNLFRTAKKQGFAVAPADQGSPELGFPQGTEVMLHVLPESLSEPRWWWLLMTNSRRPFTGLEQKIAGLLLRQWQVSFNQSQRPAAGRLLIGHDNRLIHADPWTQVQLLEHPETLRQITDTLHVVVKQRWAQLADGTVYDFALAIGGKPHWIRFNRMRHGNANNAEHWYLELYPLEEGELPIIGSIDDDRVARAVGYIHETYQEAPSLAEVARAVHVSPFHFHRLFTSSLGISPKHYLQQKQLQVAKWLLRTSREPIGSVASRAGFASHGHFSSTFQRLVGKSPSQYREGGA